MSDKKTVLGRRSTAVAGAVLAVLGLALAFPAHAEPPPWAAGLGYHPRYADSDALETAEAAQDYASAYVSGGACDRAAVSRAVGSSSGATVTRAAKPDGAPGGAVEPGGLVGHMADARVRQAMEDADRVCLGQALEFAEDGGAVAWKNVGRKAGFTAKIFKTFHTEGQYCREFGLESVVAGNKASHKGSACRRFDGAWEIQG